MFHNKIQCTFNTALLRLFFLIHLISPHNWHLVKKNMLRILPSHCYSHVYKVSWLYLYYVSLKKNALFCVILFFATVICHLTCAEMKAYAFLNTYMYYTSMFHELIYNFVKHDNWLSLFPWSHVHNNAPTYCHKCSPGR